jgi:hypothetical protein
MSVDLVARDFARLSTLRHLHASGTREWVASFKPAGRIRAGSFVLSPFVVGWAFPE